MTLYYIPGAIGNGTDYYQSDEPFKLNDVQYPSNWPKDGMEGVTPCVIHECTLDGTAFVIEEVRNGPDISYVGTSRAPEEIAENRRINVRAAALEQIDRLERSITDRMWREDAKGCVDLMDFGVDDPRTGKTATDYIAWVDDNIAVLRAAL